MPKQFVARTTVYVPLGMIEEARELGLTNLSKLVKESLEEYIGERLQAKSPDAATSQEAK